METRVSIDARAIRRYAEADALAYVDKVLGDASRWRPSLVAYRLGCEFQSDWKTEVGCWLLLARDLHVLDPLLKRISRALKHAPNPAVRGPNDSAHRLLVQELTPAMVTYYLTGMGWKFEEWEPVVPGGDADVRLVAPCGLITDIQVKAPDQPGDSTSGQVVDGEFDERVVASIDKAMTQLRASPCSSRLVVVSPQRTVAFGGGLLARHLVGRQVLRRDVWVISSDSRGAFSSDVGNGISAVGTLSLVRGIDETLYRFTVVRNPWIKAPVSDLPIECFPMARVLSMYGNLFSWHPEAPGDGFRLPSGTPYVDQAIG